MQLPHEKTSNLAEPSEPFSSRKADPTLDAFHGRAQNSPSFLQMLSNLSDVPARPAPRLSGGTIAANDPHSIQPAAMADSDGPNVRQASVLVDAAMDGRDPPVTAMDEQDPPIVKRYLTRCELPRFPYFCYANPHNTFQSTRQARIHLLSLHPYLRTSSNL